MTILITLAVLVILWMLWQLYRAKKFNQFKQQIDKDITPKLIAQLTKKYQEERCEMFPNTDVHIQASLVFWTCSRARVIQAALAHDVIDNSWIKETGNTRHCQHLFFIEKHFLLPENRVR